MINKKFDSIYDCSGDSLSGGTSIQEVIDITESHINNTYSLSGCEGRASVIGLSSITY